MPSSSKKQHNFMAAIAHSPAFAKKVGVSQSVGQDFSTADKGRKFAKGGDMATKGMGLFKGKETYGEELKEAKAIKSGKLTPQQYAKGEKSEDMMKKPRKFAIGGAMGAPAGIPNTPPPGPGNMPKQSMGQNSMEGMNPPMGQDSIGGMKPPMGQDSMGGMNPPMGQGSMGGMKPLMGQGSMGGMKPPMGKGGMGGMKPPMGQGSMGGMKPPMGQGGMGTVLPQSPSTPNTPYPSGMGSSGGMGTVLPQSSGGGGNMVNSSAAMQQQQQDLQKQQQMGPAEIQVQPKPPTGNPQIAGGGGSMLGVGSPQQMRPVPPTAQPYKKGGSIDGIAKRGKTKTTMVKKYAKGGSIDGCAQRGKTRGTMR